MPRFMPSGRNSRRTALAAKRSSSASAACCASRQRLESPDVAPRRDHEMAAVVREAIEHHHRGTGRRQDEVVAVVARATAARRRCSVSASAPRSTPSATAPTAPSWRVGGSDRLGASRAARGTGEPEAAAECRGHPSWNSSPPPTELPPSSESGTGRPSTRSFSSLPTLKNGKRFAATETSSPVFGLRPFARLAMLDDEAAEATHLDALVARERLGHAVEHGIHHHFRVPSREARIELHHLVDQLALGHLPPSGFRLL